MLHFITHEFKQFISSNNTDVFTFVAGDFWNALDFASLITMFTTYSLRVIEFIFGLGFRCESISGARIDVLRRRLLVNIINLERSSLNARRSYSPIAMSIALPLVYLNSLYYLQGFEAQGQLVSMIIGITRGVTTFILILVVVITGFAASFFVLFQKGSQTPLEYRTPALSLLSGFTLMLGDFEVDSYNDTLDFEVAIILFVVFMLLVNVILLNLLIAIMGDIFDNIQENAIAAYLLAKATIILEFESIISKETAADQAKFPKWLQVLAPAQQSGASDTESGIKDSMWAGKMRQLKKYLNQGDDKVMMRIENSERELKHEVSTLRKVISDRDEEMGNLKSECTSIREMLVNISEKLGTQFVELKEESARTDQDGQMDQENDPYVGQRCTAQFKGKGKYYPAKISKVNNDGTVNVDFDDGDKDRYVDMKSVKLEDGEEESEEEE